MTKRYKYFLIALTFVILYSASAAGVLSQTVPFETIDMGETSHFRYEDPLFQGAELVIRDMGSWERLWKLHSQGIDPPPPLPRVNFTKEMVLMVMLGYQGSGGGPRIEIVSIDEWPDDSLTPDRVASGKKSKKGMRVTVQESREPGPLMIITNPYHIVKVKNSLSVLFERSSLGNSCPDNSQCGKGGYCEKAMGNCDGTGTCQIKPDVCPLFFVYAPVCGCDGKTYDSECAAAVEGVNVLHRGRCEAFPCQNNGECVIGEFCLLAEGTCAAPGVCAPRPNICTKIYAPVCGCDGTTYGNSCEAYGSGISILYQGPCLKGH